MDKFPQSVLYKVRAATLGIFICVLLTVFFFSDKGFLTSGTAVETPSPTPAPRAVRTARPPRYSEFPHDIKAHSVSCDSCHKFPSENWEKVRAKDAFPDITDYPKHESCLTCHKQQFFKGARPAICTICHVTPSPRGGPRHAFANPREIFDTTAKGKTAVSDFSIGFPHDKHIEIVSARLTAGREFVNAAFVRADSLRRSEESCAVCHQTYKPQGDSPDEYFTTPPAKLGDMFWLKKGTFKTSPLGHTTCFTCHSPDTGILPAPTDCAACHKLKSPPPPSDFDAAQAQTMGIDDKVTLASWRKRTSSATFSHGWFSHSDLSCSTCHNVGTMNTADPKTKKVATASCATCHATATSDDGGILNFEIDSRKTNAKFQCVKCHITFGRSPVPASHIQAIEAAK